MVEKAHEADARANALEKFIKDSNAKSPGSVFTEFTSPLNVDTISTGALSVDFVLGAGGVPRGRIVELYGPEGSGKTSLALSVCANAIKEGGAAAFVDVEHALNFEHVKWMGVDTQFFVVSQPDSAEEALQRVELMCETNAFSVVVIDSVASLVPRAELEGEIGDQTMALVGRLMSTALRRLVGVAHRTNTAMIFINQLREKPGISYGSPEYTPGGRALKFYSSVRLDVRSPASTHIKEGTGTAQRVIGQVCKVSVKKNKIAAPFRTAEFRLIYGSGIDTSTSIVDVAAATGVWTARPGGIYVDTRTGEQVGRGRDNVAALLNADPQLAQSVREKVLLVMRAPKAESSPEPSDEADGYDQSEYEILS
jgi:recombination protein RecA